MTSIADAYVELHVDGDHIEGEVRKSVKKSEGPADKESDKIGRSLGERMGASFFKGFGNKIKTSGGDIKKRLSEAFKGANPKQLGIGALVAAVPLLTSGVSALSGTLVAFTGAVVQAGGASLSLVGVLGGLVQGLLVGKLAFKDFGKAVAGDADALKALSPAAQTAAKAAGALGGQWKAVTNAVQQSAFRGLAAEITSVGNAALPMLQRRLAGTGAVLNGLFRQLLGFAGSARGVELFNTALRGNNQIFGRLKNVAVPVLDGLLHVLVALQPAGERLASTIVRTGKGFQTWASAPGRAQALDGFMKRAFKSASNLWGILRNLGSTIHSVFGAATPAGDGLLKTLNDLTGRLAAFTAQVSSQNAIADWAEKGIAVTGQLFKGLGKVGAMLGPLFNPSILGNFLSVFESISPTIMSIVGVIQGALKPILESIGDAFARNGPKFAALFTALGPLLAGVGSVIGEIISQSLDMLGTIASVITPVVAVISNVLGPLLTRFAPIIAFLILGFTNWGGALVKLVPVIGKFIAPLVRLTEIILSKVGPTLEVMGKIFGVVFRGIAKVASTYLKVVATGIKAYWKVYSTIFRVGAGVIRNVVKAAFTFIRTYISTVFKVISTVVRVYWKVISTVVRVGVAAVKGYFAALRAVLGVVRAVFGAVVGAVTGKMRAVVNAVRNIAGKIKGVFKIDLAAAGRKIIETLAKGILSKLQDVKDAAGKIAKGIKGFFPGSPVKEGPLKAWNDGHPGRELMSMLTMGIYKGLPQVKKAASTAAGGIQQGLAARLKDGTVGDALQSILDKIDKTLENRNKKMGKAAAKALQRSAAEMSAAVRQVGRSLAGLTREYTRAADRLVALRDAHKDMVSSIADSLTGELSLADARLPDIEIEGGDTVEGAYTFATVSGAVKTLAGKITAFAGKLKALIAAGIPKELVQQVAGLGTDVGTKVADALLSGSKQEVKALVSDWNSINAAADTAGKVVADSFYSVGIAAQEGLIKGLLDDKRLDKAADLLATKLTAKMKRALGIASPSKLMAKRIGHPSGEGVGVGMIKGLAGKAREISQSVAGIVSPANASGAEFGGTVRGVAGQAGAPGGMATGDIDRLIAAMAGLGSTSMSVTLPTGDPEAAAQAVMNRLAGRGRR